MLKMRQRRRQMAQAPRGGHRLARCVIAPMTGAERPDIACFRRDLTI
jgi:hypothetical protein